jgi:hypothetical protein
VTKRRFIDLVRQYATLAQRNRKSYGSAVNTVFETFMQANVDAGMETAELTKQGDWAEAFLWREYAPLDRDWTPSSSA